MRKLQSNGLIHLKIPRLVETPKTELQSQQEVFNEREIEAVRLAKIDTVNNDLCGKTIQFGQIEILLSTNYLLLKNFHPYFPACLKTLAKELKR